MFPQLLSIQTLSSMAPLEPLPAPTAILEDPGTTVFAGGSDPDPLTPIDETDTNSTVPLDGSESSKAKGKKKARS